MRFFHLLTPASLEPARITFEYFNIASGSTMNSMEAKR